MKRQHQTQTSGRRPAIELDLVRLPLISVSGVLGPVDQTPAWGRWVVTLSPSTYAADLLHRGLGDPRFFPAWVDALAVATFGTGLLALARCLHHRRERALRTDVTGERISAP